MRGFRAAAVGFLVIGLLAVFRVGQVGGSADAAASGTIVSAGSDPLVIGWSVLAIAFFAVLMKVTIPVSLGGAATLKRRAAAFFIDFLFSLTVLSSITALLPLWLEARRTGHFSWQFERNYSVGSDITIPPTVLFVMVMMFLYFVLPLTRDKQTMGCFVMRLKVSPPFGTTGCFTLRDASRRLGYVLLGMATWQWARKDFLDEQGRTWWDRETNCEVVLVDFD